MVAGDDEDGDVRFAEPVELPDEVEAGVVVAPVAIVEVARDQQEIDPTIDRQLNQPLERPAGCPSDPIDGRVLVAFEAPERTVEVDIGGVDEGDRHDLWEA